MDNYNFNLLEFGGTGDLIATAICDFTSGDTSYKKDDIVLYLRDTNIQFNYSTHSSDIRARRNQIYYNDCFLDSFIIDVTPFNLQTQKLFSNLTSKTLSVIEYEHSLAMGKQILLIGEPESKESIRIPGIDSFEMISSNGITILKSELFENNKAYDIFYNKKIDCNVLELDNYDCEIPYLKVQIKFQGNLDKENSTNFFLIDKAALRITPILNLKNNSVSYVKLMFKVIESESKPKLSVINSE